MIETVQSSEKSYGSQNVCYQFFCSLCS